MKKKDKKLQEQQAQPTSEEMTSEKNIPLPEEEKLVDQTEIEEENTQKDTESYSDGKSKENTSTKEEPTEDTPDTEEKKVFEDHNWQNKVNAFFETYPLAKDFSQQIGQEIIQDKDLQKQDDCLEKAFLRVLSKAYTSPQNLANDQNFLNEYIYSNQAIKQAIVDQYLDGLQETMPPKSISSRGQITITPPSRPKSIAEAGAVIKTMLNNRRI